MYKKKYPDHIIDIYEELFNTDDFECACLSAAGYDWLPMWAYYGYNSRGFCVEYKVVKKNAIHPVHYEKERLKIGDFLLEISDLLVNAEGEIEPETEIVFNRFLYIMQGLYIKDVSWSHEKEFRVVCPVVNKPGENIDIQSIGLQTSRIIAGINSSEDVKKELNKISNRLSLGNIKCTQISKEKYGLELTEYL